MRFLAPATAFVLLLAGCVGGQSDTPPDFDSVAPPAADPGRFSETTGAIEGVVVDDAINPIPNAQVGILSLSLVVVTDAAGAFSFSNLEPGAYQVQASALGYQSAGQSVDVEEGSVANARFILTPIPTAEPFPETQTFAGLIECGWGISGAGTGNCLPIQFILQMFNLPNPTNTRTIGLFRVADKDNAKSGVFELVWDPSAATTASELSLLVEQEGAGAVGGKLYNSSDGQSPIRVEVDDEPYQDLVPEEGKDKVQTRTFPAARTPPTTVVNQRFTVYGTTCYFAACPEGFTALVDA